MNMYLIKRFSPEQEEGYDYNHEYEIWLGAVIAAKNEQEARSTHPCHPHYSWNDDKKAWVSLEEYRSNDTDWPAPKDILVAHIGITAMDTPSQTIFLNSYKAG